jgi:hypothetical protein
MLNAPELLSLAARLARLLGPDFTGQVRLHIHRGSIGTLDVLQSFKAKTLTATLGNTPKDDERR